MTQKKFALQSKTISKNLFNHEGIRVIQSLNIWHLSYKGIDFLIF